MITIKLLLDPSQWLEATWSNVVTEPDQIIPAKDAVIDSGGIVITPTKPEETIKGETKIVQLYCQSYHPTQVQMLRDKAAEFSTDLSEHEQLLTQWVTDYVPEPAPVKTITELQNEARLYLNSTDWYFARLAETGAPVPECVLAKRAEARAVLQ
jgi:hypothetical protein